MWTQTDVKSQQEIHQQRLVILCCEFSSRFTSPDNLLPRDKIDKYMYIPYSMISGLNKKPCLSSAQKSIKTDPKMFHIL